MARKVVRLWDEERTSLLACDELFVQKGKGGSNYYTAFLQEQEVEKCPVCGNEAIKLQDLFSKTYLDVINEGGKEKVGEIAEKGKQKIKTWYENFKNN